MVWNAVIFGPGESFSFVSDHAAKVATVAIPVLFSFGRMLTFL